MAETPAQDAGVFFGSVLLLRLRPVGPAARATQCNLRPRGDMYSLIMSQPNDRRTEDEQRFRALYEKSYIRILGYALRRTSGPEDAADVVADTFAIAWQKLDEIPDGTEATLWLYGVARRVLSNHRRKQQSRNGVVDLLAQEYEDIVWTDPPLGEATISRSLADAWAALTPADRDLLGLLVWETLAVEQIAAVIGCGRTGAKVRIHRARRRFARELERRGYPLKPETVARHVQAGRAQALPDTEAV